MSDSERRTAVIISAGTELTEGVIQDTHVRYVASELTSLGVSVRRGVQVPDDRQAFSQELARAISEAGLVVITGGLGPTSDDLTREIVAEAAGVPLEFRPEAWEALRARLAGRPVSDTNRKQAMAPLGFTLMPNPNGTAAGFLGRIGNALVAALPGPPSELRPMFSASLLPVVAEHFAALSQTEVLWGTALMVPESSLEEALRKASSSAHRPAGDLGPDDHRGVRWGTRVDEDRIVFSLRGGDSADRERIFGSLMERLGEVRVRRGETRPSQLLTEAALKQGARLVVAESCTGGLIAKYLTDLPGSSRVVWGGLLSYSNEAKTRLLSVRESLIEREGAVSELVAVAMAEGALAASGVEAAISVTGVAGPEGGSSEKPVGTVWMAVSLRDGGSEARRFAFVGSRDMIRRRSAVAAMLFAEARLLRRGFLDMRLKW